MIEVLNPKIVALAHTEDYGKFSVEPLERGFGHTLGNALRRVLLQHIPGAAVTAVRIEGALHEFTTLEGVYEDTTEIILNVKELAVRIEDQEADEAEARVMRLDKTGKGELTAADITCPPGVVITNPQLHIAELTKNDSSLVIEMWVEVGRGYLPVEARDRERRSADTIPIDASFSPITRVAYAVEPTRLGYRTDLDRLTIELWGDGTVDPRDALSQAAQVLQQYVSIVAGVTEAPIEEAPTEEPALAGPGGPWMQTRIEDLDFSVRTYNCLKKEKIDTLGLLVENSAEDLMAIRNFGAKSLNEVVAKLGELSLALKSSAGAEAVSEADLTLADTDPAGR